MRRARRTVGLLTLALLASCSSSSGTLEPPPGTDAGVDGSLPPPPKTATCTGSTSTCLLGTVSTSQFALAPTGTQVSLYDVYPYGAVTPVGRQPLAEDGTFAFSGLSVSVGTAYYIQAESVFGPGAAKMGNGVASVAGPFSLPSPASIAIQMKPVFLEALQQRPSGGGSTTLAWASGHVFDPATGAEVTDATVSFSNGTKSWPMPYGKNAGGISSYYVAIEAGVAGGTAFTVTTGGGALKLPQKTWNLTGEPATFDGSVSSPSPGAAVPAHSPLTVTWVPAAGATYEVVQLFATQGTMQTPVFLSPAANATTVMTETIPASALAAAGSYLLNVAYSNASCPPAADGCVYNNSTVPVMFTAQ